MFNRRCVSTNYHFLQCLNLTQKWQCVSKITCTPKEEGGGGVMRRILQSTGGTANLFMGLFNIQENSLSLTCGTPFDLEKREI